VILRLNDDGGTPVDNPFYAVGSAMGGEVGANIQRIFFYGHRNGFGMAFDPYSSRLLAGRWHGGSLYRLKLSRNRKKIDASDPKLAERVADNLTKFGPEESESLIIGKGFGTTTDIVQGPDGNLYVISITDSAIHKISRK
jgi:glucose/arabinose dehydrogenase